MAFPSKNKLLPAYALTNCKLALVLLKLQFHARFRDKGFLRLSRRGPSRKGVAPPKRAQKPKDLLSYQPS
ncbi:MAG: hypothetical protein Q8Q36_01875 [bacterium]|nr:hypothetical protein [bacterium]